MATAPSEIYLSEHVPEVIWIHGECYTLVGLEETMPDTSPNNVGDQDISRVSFDNENTEPYRSSWTACQVCVAKHYSGLHPEYTVDSTDVGTYVAFYTAPANGELRFWTLDGYLGVYAQKDKDTMHSDTNSSGGENSLSSGHGIRMANGDTVYLGDNNHGGPLKEYDENVGATMKAYFLPDNHSPGNDYT